MSVQAIHDTFAVMAVVALAGTVLMVLSRVIASVPTVRFLDGLYKVQLPLAALVAVTATLGSLYFSEASSTLWSPCRFCWFQRIFMYSAALVLVVAVAAVQPFARDLNVLARGELSARALGVQVQRLRMALYVLASLLTATAVTLVGSVGFVGLIIPHLVRLVLGNDQRVLIPAAALAGGTLLTLADTAARTVIAPQQLPVGVLTALIGVPVFLFLLARHPR